MPTYDNGFVGFWLEPGQTYNVTVSADGRKATAQIRTMADSPTCITTMRLV